MQSPQTLINHVAQVILILSSHKFCIWKGNSDKCLCKSCCVQCPCLFSAHFSGPIWVNLTKPVKNILQMWNNLILITAIYNTNLLITVTFTVNNDNHFFSLQYRDVRALCNFSVICM